MSLAEAKFSKISKEPINIFWFKRDLRIEDNDSLKTALLAPEPLLLIYLYESSIWNDSHYGNRHKVFVKESLAFLKTQLNAVGLSLYCIEDEAVAFLDSLSTKINIKTIYSTEETGLNITYQRDIAFAEACSQKNIKWYESQNNGVLRAIKNRNTWRSAWYSYMKKNQSTIEKINSKNLPPEIKDYIETNFTPFSLVTEEHNFQKGGRDEYLNWKASFFQERLAFYSEYISKPEASRYGCSRLSPYISWGVCSIRELHQKAQLLKAEGSPYKKQLTAFTSRLRWQSHFIQKFESEPRMEFEAINKGFLSLEQPLNKKFVETWKSGRTGFPLVDASLRCVAETGYINFRMRSMVVSFLTHHLFQHFTTGSAWLAAQFLDFEPGIHYGQFQMQAGLTGINTVRVYNPVKNAKDHDPDAIFIKKWVPELKDLPVEFAIEPWKMTTLEEQLYNFKRGVNYPEPLVELKESRAKALQLLYGQRKNPLSQSERLRILKLHTIRRATDKDDSIKI